MPILEEFRLTDKVAVVATDGNPEQNILTPYIAEVLAEAGARVFLIARRHEIVEDGVRRVRDMGGEAYGTLCLSHRHDEVERALGRVMDHWGRVDILVNNFQTEFGKPFAEVTETEIETLLDWNLKSVFLTCQVMGKKMLEQGRGRIVNIISGLAERGLWNSVPYCATQGAVLQLTRSLALEWGRHNIRVNALGTGWLTTEELPPEEAQKELLVRYIPLRRKGHPRDIAPMLVYLASDACDYTTGQPVYIDGGLMAHP